MSRRNPGLIDGLRAAVETDRVIERARGAVAEVARYPRGAGGEWRVVHDRTAHQGVGVYRVYVGPAQVGRQSSFPNADDCRRLERAAPGYAESSAPLPTHRNQQRRGA